MHVGRAGKQRLEEENVEKDKVLGDRTAPDPKIHTYIHAYVHTYMSK